MRNAIFAFALLLLACSVQALSIDVPQEVAVNSAFSIAIEFDSLNSFSEATVQLAGSTIVSLRAINNKLYVGSVDKSVVLNLNEDDIIEGQKLYVLLSGFKSAGDRIVKVEEVGKDSAEAAVKVFIPVSKDFEEQYLQQFDSLKNTIMSYANDIDALKRKVDELSSAVSSGQASTADLQSKLNELSSMLESIRGELSSKASLEQLNEKAAELGQAIDEQAASLNKLEQETSELTSTGFVSFAAIQNETNLVIIAAIIIIVVIVVLVAKGKLPLPKLGGKASSIYKPSKMGEEETSKAIEEAKPEAASLGKWAFKSGQEEKEESAAKGKGASSPLARLIGKE